MNIKKVQVILQFLFVLLSFNLMADDKNNSKKNTQQSNEQKSEKSPKVNSKKVKKPSYLQLNGDKLTDNEKQFIKKNLLYRRDRLKWVSEGVVLSRLKKESLVKYKEVIQIRKSGARKKYDHQLIEICLKQYRDDLKQAEILRKEIKKYLYLKDGSQEKMQSRNIVRKIITRAFNNQLNIERQRLYIVRRAYEKSVYLTANREFFTEQLAQERYQNILNGVGLKKGGRKGSHNNMNKKSGILNGLNIKSKDKKALVSKLGNETSSKGVDQSLVNLSSNHLLIMCYLKVTNYDRYVDIVELKKTNYTEFIKKINKHKNDISQSVAKRDRNIFKLYLLYKQSNDKYYLSQIQNIIAEQLKERLALEKEVLKILKKGFEINKHLCEKRLKNKNKIINTRIEYLLRDKDLDWK
ncbi:hypothetical protein AAEX28_16080 [Lentisphaerota bacterium WC36G]|nr:hypothetical protein LJT99_02835 [Lentisphaerae bacterium WC36]